MRQQQRSLRLKKLFDHLQSHFAEKLSVGTAAKLVAMSPAAFMKAFKQVAGMTLVAYLNHVRLARAAQLLRETDRSIADLAADDGLRGPELLRPALQAGFRRPAENNPPPAAGSLKPGAD